MLNRTRLTPGDKQNDVLLEGYSLPAWYDLQSDQSGNRKIHPSRLVRFIGDMHPDEDMNTGNNRGWGDSILTSAISAIKHADGTAANLASLIYESKIDVINVPQLMQNLADDDYKTRLLNRFELAAMMKGNNGMLLLDGEEEYSQKQLSMANVPESLMAFMQIVSGAADIPVTRLLGQSPSGLNSTGVNDTQNYYDSISAAQEIEMTPAMVVLDKALVRSALGTKQDEIEYIWSSLWQVSDKDRAEIGVKLASAASTIAATGLFNQEALSEAFQAQLIEQDIYPDLDASLPDIDPELSFNEGSEVDDAAPRTLYIQRKVTNAGEIIAWAKEQGFKTTLPADDMHVTVAFSRDPVDWLKVGEPWSSTMTVEEGGPRLIEQFGDDAIVLIFAASELNWRHEQAERAGASFDFPEYQPHITITYDKGDVDIARIEPYRGKIVLGPEIFDEINEDWKSGVREQK
ncbi:MAG: DUF1073 domain-containing protein [Phycisphaeraceae bacterium]|nr:DUF1073 domain-containing protein [Phycisphaeraceae bacterium]